MNNYFTNKIYIQISFLLILFFYCIPYGDNSHKTLGIANGYDILQLSNNGDDLPPEIVINLPSNGSIFASPPYFSINFSDINFEYLWVTINYSNINYGFIASPGDNVLIDTPSSIWNLLPEGHFLVRIYVNDTAGNVNYAEITLIKELPPESLPEITGAHLIIIVGCTIGILVILSAKIKKKVNP